MANVSYPGAVPPPPGETVDMVSLPSRAVQLLLACILCPLFALAFVTIRLYTATFILQRKYQTDDWLITLALTFSTAFAVCDGLQIQNGVGYHFWNVSPAQLTRFTIVGIPAAVFYNLATLFTKGSILFYLVRFASVNRSFRIVAYVVLSLVAGYSLPMGFIFLWLCQPVPKFWDPSVEGSCVDGYTPFLVASITNCVTDVVILLLPVWLLWPLRVSWQQKVATSLVLMAGGFVCAVSFVRLAAITQGGDYTDVTWVYALNLVWCLVELHVGIICACLPSTKAFAQYYFPNIFTTTPNRPSQERVQFSIPSVKSLHLRTWMRRSSSRKADEETTLQGSSDTSGSLTRSRLSSAETHGTIGGNLHTERAVEPRAASGLGDVHAGGSEAA